MLAPGPWGYNLDAMQVAVMLGDKRGGLAEVPDPVPGNGFALVKVLVVPMCTEYKVFAAGQPGTSLGHEAAGEIVTPAGPGLLRKGQRVVAMPLYGCGRCELCASGDYIHCHECFDHDQHTVEPGGSATYAQYLLRPDRLLLPVPDDLSTEHASMACCGLGPTFGAMQRMRVDALDTVLISGMGPVGLGGVINGVARHARVIAVEPTPWRARLARELGAAEVLDGRDAAAAVARVRELTGGRGADQAIDCSGNAAAQRLLVDAVRRRGEMAFVGEAGEFTLHVSNDLIRKGLTLHGQWHYNLADGPRIMDVIRRSRSLLDGFITHRFPMSRAEDAWKLQVTGECGKVLLDPWA